MMSSINWKYITYRNAVRGGPSHGQHAQKFGKVWLHGFQVMRADRHTNYNNFAILMGQS